MKGKWYWVTPVRSKERAETENRNPNGGLDPGWGQPGMGGQGWAVRQPWRLQTSPAGSKALL